MWHMEINEIPAYDSTLEKWSKKFPGLCPKLKNDHASAPKIVGKYDSLTNFSTVFRPSLCPQKMGAEACPSLAPKIEEMKCILIHLQT